MKLIVFVPVLAMAALPPQSRAAEIIDYGTMRNGIRTCPVNRIVTGVDLNGNRLLCSDSFGPYSPAATFELLTGNRNFLSTRACPEGYGVTGVSPVRNLVSCAHLGLMETVNDGGTMRLGMRACPAGMAVIGVDLNDNDLICGRRVDFCFGGLGQRCGPMKEGLSTPLALCANGTCFINAGSWIHDECCWRFPNGMACTAGPTAPHDGHCTTEFAKAVLHLAAGYNWPRQVSFDERTLNGNVRFNAYCAPNGFIVHRDDINRCCSRNGRPVNVLTDAPLIARQDLKTVEIMSGAPRVCRP